MADHRHVWCVVDTGKGGMTRARFRCRCGLVALDVFILAALDIKAYQQFVDPDGLQRAFMATTGLDELAGGEPPCL